MLFTTLLLTIIFVTNFYMHHSEYLIFKNTTALINNTYDYTPPIKWRIVKQASEKAPVVIDPQAPFYAFLFIGAAILFIVELSSRFF